MILRRHGGRVALEAQSLSVGQREGAQTTQDSDESWASKTSAMHGSLRLTCGRRSTDSRAAARRRRQIALAYHFARETEGMAPRDLNAVAVRRPQGNGIGISARAAARTSAWLAASTVMWISPRCNTPVRLPAVRNTEPSGGT